MSQTEHVLKVNNRLGETPIWSPEENALYWVDWGGKPTCKLDPASGELTTFEVGPLVTSLARRASGGWIAIAQDGIYGWDPNSNQYQLIHGLAVPDKPEISYNDAAVDRQGRLVVGTVNLDDPFLPEGSLYRLDPDGTFEELDTGYATANGIGFSPDGRTIYVADQRNYQIIALDYDLESGTTSNRRVFATLKEEDGMPDGLIVDADGYIWNGHWAGWKLTRYAPDGSIERQIEFPVQHVISFAFGGSELDILFVTTASWGFSDQDWEKQPQAGDLFQVTTGIKGLIEPAFEG
jgi:sugar lactone lactonase YvrE